MQSSGIELREAERRGGSVQGGAWAWQEPSRSLQQPLLLLLSHLSSMSVKGKRAKGNAGVPASAEAPQAAAAGPPPGLGSLDKALLTQIGQHLREVNPMCEGGRLETGEEGPRGWAQPLSIEQRPRTGWARS